MDNFKAQVAFAYETFKQMENKQPKRLSEEQEIEMLETTYSIKIIRK